MIYLDQDSVSNCCAWTNRLLLCDRLQGSQSLEEYMAETEIADFSSRFKNENRYLLLDAKRIEATGWDAKGIMHRYYDV